MKAKEMEKGEKRILSGFGGKTFEGRLAAIQKLEGRDFISGKVRN